MITNHLFDELYNNVYSQISY